MTDPDEAQLSKLAKKMLATPHKKREDSKLGKLRAAAKEQANTEPRANSRKVGKTE
jgi:hypothetical protein